MDTNISSVDDGLSFVRSNKCFTIMTPREIAEGLLKIKKFQKDMIDMKIMALEEMIRGENE